MIKLLINFAIIILFVTEIYPQSSYPKRELRGAWIATVKNIDWPSSNLESTEEQKNEFQKKIDKSVTTRVLTYLIN